MAKVTKKPDERPAAAVARGDVIEIPGARTFGVCGSSGSAHLVTVAPEGSLPRPMPHEPNTSATCSCPAGRAGVTCWHVRAVALTLSEGDPNT